ncbi:MAG: hypothetical protein U5Q16_06935 [Gammaproteobacteria bacterium]|nr:hypothetical protein [Gammaproteobacteria bacterium]
MILERWQQYLQDAEPTHSDCGIAWLADLAVVSFTGRDARAFLQGYLTCDTDHLSAGRLTPTALCNLQGRVVMNGWCAPMEDQPDGGQTICLVLHASLVERLTAFLRPYLMFSKTTATDLREEAIVLASLDADEPGGLILDERRRLFPQTSVEGARKLWDAHPHITQERWLAALTADGYPLVSAPVSESFLPQMLDLQRLGAINFEKGCYLGQEVVARAQHRGRVKRRLARLTWLGPAAPGPGAEITDDAGKARGIVLQSAHSTADGGPLLAVLSEQAADNLRQGDAHLSRVA